MISHKYKCIFVEVPKTGSTSIRSLLGIPPKPHLNIWQTKYELENYWTHYGGAWNRLLAALYLLVPSETRAWIGNATFQSYFKFGFVRNPWDRVVSLYERREGLQLRQEMSFEEFVQWLRFSSGTCIHPMPHRNQLDWFVDPHGNLQVDFIGRFETLVEDWAFIARKIGLAYPLPHANRNPKKTKHYSEYYSAKTRRLVAERFSEDIAFFGYEFDESHAPLRGALWHDANYGPGPLFLEPGQPSPASRLRPGQTQRPAFSGGCAAAFSNLTWSGAEPA